MNQHNNNNSKKKFFWAFIILLVIITALRATSLNEFLYDDEANFSYTLSVMNDFGINEEYHSAIILNLLYIPLLILFGFETWVFRLLPLLFSIINATMVYYYAKEKYNEKAAFWAGAIMLISLYASIAALQFDVEGNIIVLCAILTFYFYDKSLKQETKIEDHSIDNIKNNKTKKITYQILAGIALGIAVITKQNAGILAIIFLVYAGLIHFVNFSKNGNNNNKTNLIQKSKLYIKDSIIVGGSALLTFSLSFIWTAISGIEATSDTAGGINIISAIISPDVGKYFAKHFTMVGPTIFFLWATPLLLGCLLLFLQKKQFKRDFKDINLPLIWVVITTIFYTFIITFGAHDKYFMHTIPALAMLAGFYISKISWDKKRIITAISITSIWLLFLYFLNTRTIKFVIREPAAYLTEILKGNLAFLFSYTSSSGPMLGVSFSTIFLTFTVAFAAIAIIILGSYFFSTKHKKNTITSIFIIFLSVSFAFNIFVTTELIFHPTTIDMSEAQWEAIDYVKQNNLPHPIYSNNQGIHWYFDHEYWHNYENVIGFGDYELEDSPELAMDSIKERGGTIILVNWPPIPDGSPAFEVIALCEEVKSFEDKGYTTVQIFSC